MLKWVITVRVVAAVVASARAVAINLRRNYEIHKIKILDTSTVADLKSKILSATSIPISREILTGWIPNEAQCTDLTILRTLNLERTNELILKDSNDKDFIDFMDEDGLDYTARENEIFIVLALFFDIRETSKFVKRMNELPEKR